MNNLHKLLLETVEINNKNIAELIEHMDDKMQQQALEILCGVYKAPEVYFFEGSWVKPDTRTEPIKIVKQKWNPLKCLVEYHYKLHKTLKVSHDLYDEDLELLKINLLDCESRDEAEKLNVFSGSQTVWLPYGVLTTTHNSTIYVDDWNDYKLVEEKDIYKFY
jgi:hypothetical protein